MLRENHKNGLVLPNASQEVKIILVGSLEVLKVQFGDYM